MTTAKIAALQQIQGIQRFFKSPTVKDGTLNQRICQWIKKILLIYSVRWHFQNFPVLRSREYKGFRVRSCGPVDSVYGSDRKI